MSLPAPRGSRTIGKTSTRWAKCQCWCTAKKLTQSGVILIYLSDLTGKFKPQGEDERLEALRWIIFDNQKVSGFLGPFRFLKNFAKPPGDPAVMAFLKARIDGSLAIVNKRLASHTYLLGDRPT